ncbi:MAG: flagellar export protein FliJ [Clostridiales bacterium]|nr:flagellar export protein FliJ [Clostridiales bacterium]
MAKFVFRLQSYLSIKEKLEEQKKNEYGQAMAAVEKEKQIKQQITEKKTETLGGFKSAVSGSIDPRSLERFHRFVGALKKREEQQEIVIQKAEKTAEERRAELVERMRERKALDILKEKNYAEYLKEEQRAEQKAVDELVSFKYNSKEPEE